MIRIYTLTIIVCFGLLLGPLTDISAAAGPSEGLDVNVINTIPIPVTPVTTEDEKCDREHVILYGIVDGTNPDLRVGYDVIPEGKAFVIEFVTLQIKVPGGDYHNEPFIYEMQNELRHGLFLIPLEWRYNFGGSDTYSAALQVKAVIPGHDQQLYIYIANYSRFFLTVHGYYTDVDCPQP